MITQFGNASLINQYAYYNSTARSTPNLFSSPVEEVDDKKGEPIVEDEPPVKVEVPTMDDESIVTFFGKHSEVSCENKIEVTVDDFDDLFINSNEM